jgi:hypothetical protein
MTEGRTIAIGDVHGCSTALAALVRAIDPTPVDTLVFLGDYIDTFCHGGGWLTALEVGTGKVWQADEAGELKG